MTGTRDRAGHSRGAKVVSVAVTPVLQNFWKKTGKNPAMTVVAKAEFAQSYSAQADDRSVRSRTSRHTRSHRSTGDGVHHASS